jgi:hypothetical protein
VELSAQRSALRALLRLAVSSMMSSLVGVVGFMRPSVLSSRCCHHNDTLLNSSVFDENLDLSGSLN